MERFTPYLGVAAGVSVVAFSLLVWGGISATGDVSGIPTAALPASPVVATSTPTTPTTAPTPRRATVAATQTEPAAPRERNVALDAAAPNFLNALVNIICYAPLETGLHSISASGVTIDPKGIILTNAHVAQYLLLADKGVVCAVRTGRPAVSRYGAALIYISPTWLAMNADMLTSDNPRGDGEDDFALVAMIATDQDTSPLPYMPLATTTPEVGDEVLIGSYGAQSLQSKQILSDLYSTLVLGFVHKVLTFSSTSDVLSFVGSAASQEGSSGGGVVNETGQLAATITTSTIEGDTSTRVLNALTASYIRREFERETKGSIDMLLAEPLSTAIASFATQIPTLEALLTAYL